MDENKQTLINGLTEQETEQSASCAGLVGNASKQAERVRPHVTVQYDLSPAETESQLRAKLIEMGWTPPEQNKQAEPVAVDHSDLIKRIDSAIDRVTQGRGLMSITADPRSDVDLVLSECKTLLQGENPPFWAKDFYPAPSVAVNEHVNETPKSEHDSNDVLTEADRVNQIGDANKMVRLTNEDIDAHFERERWVSVTFSDGAKGIALDKVTARDFANAIMDAMIKKNGG